MIPQTTGLWMIPAESSAKSEARTVGAMEKTHWRIEEARSMFALMREQYKESKRLFVPKRYSELKRIIEMFTAEPITQRLQYLCTVESERRHMKALQLRKSNSSNSTTFSNKSNTSSSSNSNRSVRGSNRSVRSDSTASCRLSVVSKTDTDKCSDLLNFIAKNTGHKSNECDNKNNQSTASFSSIGRQQPPGSSSGRSGYRGSSGSNSRCRDSNPLLTNGSKLSGHSLAMKRRKRHFTPTVAVADTCSEDEVFEIDYPEQDMGKSDDCVRPVNCGVYDISGDIVSPLGRDSTVFTFPHIVNANQQKGQVGKQKHFLQKLTFSQILPKMTSFESFFTSNVTPRPQRISESGPSTSFNVRSFTGPHFTDTILNSSYSTPTLAKGQGYPQTGKTHSSQPSTPRPYQLIRTGSHRNIVRKDEIPTFCIPYTRQAAHKRNNTNLSSVNPLERKSEALYCKRSSLQVSNRNVSFDSLDIQRRCSALTRDVQVASGSSMALRYEETERTNPGKSDGKSIKSSDSSSSSYSSELFFLETKSAHSKPKASENGTAAIDNLVLTIAHDHITRLRTEYNSLRGMNIWRRYRRMKVMLKSCMNILS
ncbi:hypothetical protein PoB_006156200 [Plakobranchus ocellatus]|uniref:Uncharacterized protein n=1 Tax=Plakobranchus ocellatus TaxID=259542 RepID=A0AAV4CT33_9GAST|nr:hypothetical protein PoB_006156200 [Plakobranchus ocellatus]